MTGAAIPLVLDANGNMPDWLSTRPTPGEARFTFTYHQIPFQGHCRNDAGGATLSLGGDLAYMPFTAEARDVRLALQRMVRDPAHPGLRLAQHRLIRIEASGAVESPVTPMTLLTAVVALILGMRPTLIAVHRVSGGGLR